MVIARRDLISEKSVSIVHTVSRTVRRAWLMGDDPLSKKNFDHRKSWVKSRLIHLSRQFSIEVCGYAIMCNHTHLVLRNRPDFTDLWTPYEVATRWWQLFPKRRDSRGNPLKPKDHELDIILFDKKTGESLGRLQELRTRLSSISWFMRCLNEHIARKANWEDRCTGRFCGVPPRQGRFKSVELLDQAAVLACMAYVDLNPIHAGMAKTPETSDYTSAQDRIYAAISRKKLAHLRETYHKEKSSGKPGSLNQIETEFVNKYKRRDAWLSPINKWPYDKPIDAYASFMNVELEEYLSILDWTGKQHRSDKSGQIPRHLEPILKRMDIETKAWLRTVKQFDNWFYRVAGRVEQLSQAAQKLGKKWLAGKTGARTAFT